MNHLSRLSHFIVASQAVAELLKQNQLSSFEQVWEAKLPWFEPPNQRRNGWSGVSEHQLHTASGNHINIFIKRQENHNTFSIQHPITGIPTFYREFNNLKRLYHLGIGAPQPLLYAERTHHGKKQAVLITKALDGYCSLENWYQRYSKATLTTREKLLSSLAICLRNFHNHHLVHNCLYPKHIFVTNAENPASFQIYLIDLEKTKRVFNTKKHCNHDLQRFIRHANIIPEQDIQYFIDHYQHVDKRQHYLCAS
ncbi:hypothetical protein KCM76_05965 [Zooshikella marina]|uniref:lipopolysaccharide kinase InaA family protein n=1 Tax=Zooshikella ganghwensis TaxID=202772 RepID=UPI001BB0C743|nr:lipopolysaccharide kinase InaA family protein [Zooshikella ganghwensis]MBU2705516.1 hypothetical protein [Zooshikella ganghwensis]